MIFGSLFSGIEAASVAWNPLGWRCAWTAEIDPFACALLRHRYPDVPNLGDVNGIGGDAVEPVDLIVFGSPCQSFSVAGKRLGMDDPRGNMALVGLSVVERLRPRWVVFENVPGLLSSDGWRDFGSFLGALGQCGYGFAYRVLDAQHFGVPQRRRRVFVVGHLGDWRPPAAVLFEPESLRGDPAPRREAGERVAASLTRGVDSGGKGGYAGRRREDDENLIARCVTAREGQRLGHQQDTLIAFDWRASPSQSMNRGSVAPSLSVGRADGVATLAHCLRADGFDAGEDGTGRVIPLTLAIRGRGDSRDFEWRDDGVANAILTPNGGRAGIGVGAVAFAQNSRDECREMPYSGALSAEPGMKQTPYVRSAMSVRRLTPRECERLQEFPDDYTLIPYRGKAATDGPRYRAIGNSFAVPAVRWIGQRVQLFEDATRSLSGKQVA